MKNINVLFLLLALWAASCTKRVEQPENHATKKQQVTFTTSGFEQIISEIQGTKSGNRVLDDSLNKYAPKLYFQLYKFDDDTKTNGFLAGSTSYLRTDPNFGTISGAFEPGHYVAIFLASGHQFNRYGGIGEGLQDYRYSDCHINTMRSVLIPFVPIDQIFYKKVFFDVASQPINQQVTLTRLVAGLDVVIKDAIPANITSIRVTVDDAPIYNFSLDTAYEHNDKIEGISPQQTASKTISMYVLAKGTRNVRIEAFAGDQSVVQKNVSTTFYTNKKTKLEGNLFTSDVSFTVSIDPTWGTPGPTIPF